MAMRRHKIINDCVFGTIEFPRVCVKIMDTAEFQRLRYIQQVGCTTFVYPSATHSRFQHSIGVFYIAKKMVEKLKETQGKVEEAARITDIDVLCVSVAAMCHDLGHGPYSHLWEHFMKKAQPEKKWKHENTSILMFQRIWNKLSPSDKWPLQDIDRVFIEELIQGVEDPGGIWKCKGRSQCKSFLYEIVANKVNGVDVDRFAYITQDCYYLGFKNQFDFSRLLELAQVVDVNGRNVICFKTSEVLNIYAFFQTRWNLHRQAYRHRVSRLTEAMFIDALLLADDSLWTTGKNGVKLKLSDTVDDLDAYLNTVDSVYHRILLELSEDHPARQLLNRIQTRDLYVEVAKKLMPKGVHKSAKEIKEDMLEIEGSFLDPDDFYINVEDFDFGMQGENPVKFVNFYDIIDSVPVHVKEHWEVSHVLPETYEEEYVHVVCKRNNAELCSAVKAAFKTWVQNNVTETNGSLCVEEGH